MGRSGRLLGPGKGGPKARREVRLKGFTNKVFVDRRTNHEKNKEMRRKVERIFLGFCTRYGIISHRRYHIVQNTKKEL